MIDIHCHILPSIDDGAKNMEESIQMAQIAAKDGVRTIVATPHVNENAISFDEIKERTTALNNQLEKLSIPVKIVPGAEIVAGLPAEFVKQYSINNNGYVLIEFPHTHLPMHSMNVLNSLVSEGLRPVIAHPERNPSIISKPKILLDIVEETGSLVQVTANSISGEFGRAIRLCANHLLKKGVVNIIASDAHSAKFRRPELHKGLKGAGKAIGRENAQKLVFDNPEAVINGKVLS